MPEQTPDAKRTQRATELSVDSLKRIYAFLTAISLGESVRRCFLDRSSGEFSLAGDRLQHLPTLLAFLVTTVPIFHGMNRLLDDTYLLDPQPRRGTLLLDVAFALFEACSFFIVAAFVDRGAMFFKGLAVLLVAEGIWGLVAYWAEKGEQHVWKRAVVDLPAAGLILLLAGKPHTAQGPRLWFLLAVCLARTACEYWWCWRFFFPEVLDSPNTHAGTAAAVIETPRVGSLEQSRASESPRPT